MEERLNLRSTGGVVRISGPIKAPILVTGLGRSGTTAIHRALSAVGVRSYYNPVSMNAEDEMTDLVRDDLQDTFSRVYFDRKRESGPNWSTKIPFDYIEEWVSIHPFRVVIVTRDFTAWLDRQIKDTRTKDVSHLYSMYESGMTRLVKWAMTLPSVCLVSYEKALSVPSVCLPSAFGALGLSPSPSQVQSAREELRLNDPRYLVDPLS